MSIKETSDIYFALRLFGIEAIIGICLVAIGWLVIGWYYERRMLKKQERFDVLYQAWLARYQAWLAGVEAHQMEIAHRREIEAPSFIRVKESTTVTYSTDRQDAPPHPIRKLST